MKFLRFLMVLMVATAVGCGAATTSTDSVSVDESSATDDIKSALETVVETGEIDSGIMMVEEKLEELKETDAAKAEDLLKDLAELQETTSPDAAKAKAKEMLEKL